MLQHCTLSLLAEILIIIWHSGYCHKLLSFFVVIFFFFVKKMIMEESNNNIINIEYAEISSFIRESLKDNPNASKNNDFAIRTYPLQKRVAILISLGAGKEKIISTIKKKIGAGEFVVKKDKNNEDELYFVFFKKDLQKQPTDNNVKDVLLLPSNKILYFFNRKNGEKTALQLAKLFRDHIVANRDMNWQQKIFDLYNGKNNESNIINQDNNEDNNKNSINNVKEEDKEIKKDNNNIEEKENDIIINESIDLNIIIKKDNNEDNNKSNISNVKEEENKNKNNNSINGNGSQSQENDEELQEKLKNENTVSLFGLGCYQIQSDERNNHTCSGCFW